MSEHRNHIVAEILSYEWKIENFLHREYNGAMIEIPKFLLHHEKFAIRIFATDEWVSINLQKDFSRTEQRVECTLQLKCDDGSMLWSRNFSHFFLPESGLGYLACIKKSMLNSIMEEFIESDDTLTVSCEFREADIPTVDDNLTVSLVEAEIQTSLEDSYQMSLLKDFEKFYLSKCQTDVLLDVRGEKFPAHRFVLSSRSSVFRSMFEVDMKEKETGTVNVTDCDPLSFGSFLLFLYSGRLELISSDNALGLYAAADKYNVQDLKKESCACLSRELSVDLVCDVLRLATLHEEWELLKCATTYFIENASKIVRTPQWQILFDKNPTMAKELFIKVVDTLTDSLAKTAS